MPFLSTPALSSILAAYILLLLLISAVMICEYEFDASLGCVLTEPHVSYPVKDITLNVEEQVLAAVRRYGAELDGECAESRVPGRTGSAIGPARVVWARLRDWSRSFWVAGKGLRH